MSDMIKIGLSIKALHIDDLAAALDAIAGAHGIALAPTSASASISLEVPTAIVAGRVLNAIREALTTTAEGVEVNVKAPLAAYAAGQRIDPTPLDRAIISAPTRPLDTLIA